MDRRKKALLGAGFLVCVLGLSEAAHAARSRTPLSGVGHSVNNLLACGELSGSFKLNGRQTVRTGTFGAIAAQGLMLFINGPEKRYVSSRSLIQNFCHHGFTVFAFNVTGRKPTEANYLKAARTMLQKIRKAYPTQKLVAYGWSRGASVATELVKENSAQFERLVLESPGLSTNEALSVARIPRRMTRIFACPADRHVQFRNIRLTHRAYVYVPAHAVCGHSLSANAEARDPLVDFIESDFAGVEAQNWYWTRRL